MCIAVTYCLYIHVASQPDVNCRSNHRCHHAVTDRWAQLELQISRNSGNFSRVWLLMALCPFLLKAMWNTTLTARFSSSECLLYTVIVCCQCRTRSSKTCLCCRQQKSKQQQQRVAEELFNANVRVQKQPAVSKPARGRGRGRGRAV